MISRLYLIILFGMIIFQTASAQNKGGRWQFEQNGFDTADWDNQSDDGELQGDANYASINAVEGNSYLFLDTLSQNDYFITPDSPDLDFTNENIAISAWIYPIILNEVHYILNKGDQFPEVKTTNYSLRISNGKKLEFLIRDASNRAQVVSSSFNILVGQWIFIAIFYDYNAGKVYMWDDPLSGPKDTLDFQQDYFANNDPLSIGSWYRSDTLQPSIRDFQGRIDDVRISNSIDNVIATQITDEHGLMPNRFRLNQNFPNPFNSTTNISFQLASTGHVLLEVYDITGRRIITLINKTLNQGNHKIVFNAENLSTGIYFYRMENSDYISVKKMILFK